MPALCLQMNEFRHKMGTLLPKLSRDGPPGSRTEFDGLSDLMQYISTWQPEHTQQAPAVVVVANPSTTTTTSQTR